jgi:hypothetical protein
MDEHELEETILTTKKGKKWKKTFKKLKRWDKWIIVAVIAVLLAGGVGYRLYRTYKENVGTSHTTEELGEYIKSIGELATAEYDYTMCQVAEKSSFIISTPFTSSKVIYSYSGTIKAGIKINDAKFKLDPNTATVYVVLPEAEILSSELDQNSLEIYDEKQGFFSKLSMEDLNSFQQELKAEAEKKAISKGLLESAKENAKTIVEQMISSVAEPEGYKVTVK